MLHSYLISLSVVLNSSRIRRQTSDKLYINPSTQHYDGISGDDSILFLVLNHKNDPCVQMSHFNWMFVNAVPFLKLVVFI